jgi:hypothetical protein
MMKIIYMALIIVFVDWMGACLSQSSRTTLRTTVPMANQVNLAKQARNFHQRVETNIPIILPTGNGELAADIFRPTKKILPKTLVIIVPAAGNVSRHGEISGDGIRSYPKTLDASMLWAKALSDNGIFVLSYDKRTCNKAINPICNNNDQQDIDQYGIISLAKDLDQVYEFSSSRFSSLGSKVKIVLLSFTQGTQVITLADCAKKISGMVLFSPIIEDLQDMWVQGLGHAAEKLENKAMKNKLLNRKESIRAFFDSLSKGDFPKTANIRGASVNFWLSWIEASKNTLERLMAYKRPGLLLFSEQDSFRPKKINNNDNLSRLTFRSFAGVDRNFVVEDGVPKAVLQQVLSFIKDLPSI